MKVLWFSNCNLCDNKNTSTGSWLYSMMKLLSGTDLQLFNITQGGKDEVQYQESKYVKQYVVPVYPLMKNGVPSVKNIQEIVKIVLDVSPDLIHVWGMEAYWGLLFSRKYITGYPVLLEIQGIKYACQRVFYGGLSFIEQIRTIGIKELLLPSRSIFYQRRIFEKHAKIEEEILSSFQYISYQSEWVRGQIQPYVSMTCSLYKTRMSVRDVFLKDENSWKSNVSHKIAVVASGPIPYKGIHDAIRMISIVKKKFSDVQLHIIGNFGNNLDMLRKSGYVKFLEKLIKKEELEEHVFWQGAMTAEQMVEFYQGMQVLLVPSYVESYCLVLAEGLSLGIPTIASYAGAMPELVENGNLGMLYSTGDINDGAYKLIQMLTDITLCQEYKNKSKKNSAYLYGMEEKIKDRQLSIYNNVIGHSRL